MRPLPRRCRHHCSAAAADSPIKKKFPQRDTERESERDICAKIKLMCPPKQPQQQQLTERRSQRSTVALWTSVAVVQPYYYDFTGSQIGERERENLSWLPLQGACDCDWTKSTPYLKITHSASRSHAAGGAPLTQAASQSVQRCSPESALSRVSERFAARAVTLAAAVVEFNSNFDFAAFRRVRKNLKTIRVTRDITNKNKKPQSTVVTDRECFVSSEKVKSEPKHKSLGQQIEIVLQR